MNVATGRRPDESMTLLVEVMESPLDAGYAQAARRRAAGERRHRSTLALLGLLAVLLGLMTVAAAQQLRAPVEGVSAREVLQEEILARQATAEDLRERSAALSAEITALNEETLAAQDSELVDRLRLDGVTTGSVAVSGPGLVVTLSDGAVGTAQDGSATSAPVQAIDLQRVVNALWASGAEAISVGGERLTSVSAIRHAGQAIMVDLVPLPGPSYAVEAIGDPEAMQTAYARTDAPAYTQLLSSQYGIGSSLETADSLELAGVGSQLLRYAEPVEADVSPDEDQEGNP
ncbi:MULTISPECIES: DUF881 domain-containing protein [unclassified Isoptericola]|uniref:DUF881 domain-containing protein n=1 Tax=unclassified Isoptericola TaxID=2623355 RepID=UPI0027138672|nr:MULTISPECIES: DUF881 domain-containing protein [unclassified Isoptericola]MDO8144793.1 DUF881 domain-containing protein [Isoptericola sp. 178]MDO8152507.1 DUF881 domain-containing protein [Isoptericola sp. b408]